MSSVKATYSVPDYHIVVAGKLARAGAIRALSLALEIVPVVRPSVGLLTMQQSIVSIV